MDKMDVVLQPVGFWKRFLAYFIDTVILFIIYSVLSFLFIGEISLIAVFEDNMFLMSSSFILFYIILWVISFLYFGFLACTSLQGTIGKRLLRIKIVNEHGERITFRQAVIRFLVYTFLSPILYIGFIMIGLTKHKQGLHDMLAKTYCVKR